jgi:hypothetical protein
MSSDAIVGDESPSNKSLDRSGGGVFCNLIRPARLV